MVQQSENKQTNRNARKAAYRQNRRGGGSKGRGGRRKGEEDDEEDDKRKKVIFLDSPEELDRQLQEQQQREPPKAFTPQDYLKNMKAGTRTGIPILLTSLFSPLALIFMIQGMNEINEFLMLPVEILTEIASYLTFYEKCRLSLVCRYV